MNTPSKVFDLADVARAVPINPSDSAFVTVSDAEFLLDRKSVV